jgi:hypothetical protein
VTRADSVVGRRGAGEEADDAVARAVHLDQRMRLVTSAVVNAGLRGRPKTRPAAMYPRNPSRSALLFA